MLASAKYEIEIGWNWRKYQPPIKSCFGPVIIIENTLIHTTNLTLIDQLSFITVIPCSDHLHYIHVIQTRRISSQNTCQMLQAMLWIAFPLFVDVAMVTHVWLANNYLNHLFLFISKTVSVMTTLFLNVCFWLTRDTQSLSVIILGQQHFQTSQF